MTKEEKNRKLADWLGFKHEVATDINDVDQWHFPTCRCESKTPDGLCTCVQACYWDDNGAAPDFYVNEEVNGLLLEKMPEPQLWLESSKGQPKYWGCIADIDSPVRGISYDADRKTAIAECALIFISELTGLNR